MNNYALTGSSATVTTADVYPAYAAREFGREPTRRPDIGLCHTRFA
jgi:hypothetical protein